MKKTLLASLALTALLASGAAMAQATTPDTDVPGHPRVNQIDERLENQQKRIDQGVAQGQINAKQAAHDEAVDNKVSQQLSADEAKHNGHITKAEQRQLNKKLNKNSKRIHRQRHKPATTPASAAVPPAQQ